MKYFFKTYWYECEISQEVYFFEYTFLPYIKFLKKSNKFFCILARHIHYIHFFNEISIKKGGIFMKLKKVMGLCLSAVITAVSSGICLAEKTASPKNYPNNEPFPAYSETGENGGIPLSAAPTDLKYAVDGGYILYRC